tara:strand:+ start:175 stop:528 length:354 start_codon:yes stop_codon:yes gene_type:complete
MEEYKKHLRVLENRLGGDDVDASLAEVVVQLEESLTYLVEWQQRSLAKQSEDAPSDPEWVNKVLKHEYLLATFLPRMLRSLLKRKLSDAQTQVRIDKISITGILKNPPGVILFLNNS